jgi:hypothetical protein
MGDTVTRQHSLSLVHRLSIACLLVAGIVLCQIAWAGIYRMGRADSYGHHHHVVALNDAPSVAPLFFEGVPDVLDQPSESVDLLTKLWRDGQVANAIILASFLGLTLASRKVPWLSEGHRAVYVAAIISGLGMLAESASRGTTPNISMVVGAVMAAMALVMNGKAPAQVAAGLPVARALKSPDAFTLTPRPTLDLEKAARVMHAGFTTSMGIPQSFDNLSDDTRQHWIAAARAVSE